MKPLVMMILSCGFVLTEARSQTIASSQSTLAHSPHFIVRTTAGTPAAPDVLRLCDTVRTELQHTWGMGLHADRWQPRCEVIVHGSRGSYLAAVGEGGSQTWGSSLIHVEAGTVKLRRIDLLADPQGDLTALPHELTHVVLADRFGGIPTPHWIDEGIAMLADTREKQLLHDRDCQEAIASRTALSIARLVTLEQFTSPDQMPAFYGQSLSLVKMLAEHGASQKIVSFGIDARRIGYDRALRDYYGIQGLTDLERRWRAYVANKASTAAVAPIVMVTFKP